MARARLSIVCLAAALAVPQVVLAQARTYAGRPVAEVLQDLQTAGLRILFSSDLVPGTLRVKSEPKVEDPRKIALQILAPHGLTVEDGPRGTLLVVARPKAAAPAERPRQKGAAAAGGGPPPDSTPQPDAVRIEEWVDVTDRLVQRTTGSTTWSLPPAVVRETAGGLENLFQVFQLLPGAAAVDDESGRLAVRGAGPEHNMVVLDGVQIHNPYRFSELTSSFLNPDTAARVSLDASGLDAQHGGRLSSVTIIETRDGSRDRRLAVSAAMGLASGDVLLEGRLPGSESGAWWLTARGTYYRPLVDLFRTGVLPSFSDVQFKVTARPTTRTTLSVFGLAGRETMHGGKRGPDEGRGAEFDGVNRLGVMNLAWTPSSRFVSTTTLSLYAHEARDFDDFAVASITPFEKDVSVTDFAVRQRAAYAITSRHVVDAGVEAHRIRSSWRMAGEKPEIFWRGIGPSTWGEMVVYPPGGAVDSRLDRTQVGLWLQDRIPIGQRISLEPGVRMDWNSFTRESIWQPRLRVAGRFGGAAAWVGFAAQTQTPSHESLLGFDFYRLSESDGATLRNERSRQLVAGFERGLGAGFDVRVEAYRRRLDRLLLQRLETDAERAARLSAFVIPPDLPADSVILEHRPTVHPESTGRGTATGVEVLLQRNGERASGWVGYTFSRTRREAHGFSFPFDFDRPHTVSAVGSVKLSARLRLAATVLRSSGFAITPVREEVFFAPVWRPDGTIDPISRPSRRKDGSFFMSPNPFMRRLSTRNADRLSGYARVDVRATYATLGRWEFYGEVINLFGTRNYLQAFPIPSIAGAPEEGTTANNVYENFERFPSFGVRVRF